MCIWLLYYRNHNNDFGNMLCVWVLGPLGTDKGLFARDARETHEAAAEGPCSEDGGRTGSKPTLH